MKECPECHRTYADANRFCTIDGSQLIESSPKPDPASEAREAPAHEALPLRMTIIDQEDDDHRSRVIQGRVLDAGHQGMRIQTGTIETGQLNLIRDHTIAFKNKLELEIDLPEQTIRLTGFAAWYKPAADGINWNAGIYIRDMAAADRRAYDEFLANRSAGSTNEQGQ